MFIIVLTITDIVDCVITERQNCRFRISPFRCELKSSYCDYCWTATIKAFHFVHGQKTK